MEEEYIEGCGNAMGVQYKLDFQMFAETIETQLNNKGLTLGAYNRQKEIQKNVQAVQYLLAKGFLPANQAQEIYQRIEKDLSKFVSIMKHRK